MRREHPRGAAASTALIYYRRACSLVAMTKPDSNDGSLGASANQPVCDNTAGAASQLVPTGYLGRHHQAMKQLGPMRIAERMQALTTTQLVLDPLVAGHAEAMFELLSEKALYRYLDYPPPLSVEHLRNLYARLESRQSPDGTELWLNWVVRPRGQSPIGYVQATVTSHKTAWVAYVFSSKHWCRGFAMQATQAVVEHLASAYGIARYLATVDAENQRSIRLLERLGFHPASTRELEGHDLSATERLFAR